MISRQWNRTKMGPNLSKNSEAIQLWDLNCFTWVFYHEHLHPTYSIFDPLVKGKVVKILADFFSHQTDPRRDFQDLEDANHGSWQCFWFGGRDAIGYASDMWIGQGVQNLEKVLIQFFERVDDGYHGWLIWLLFVVHTVSTVSNYSWLLFVVRCLSTSCIVID